MTVNACIYLQLPVVCYPLYHWHSKCVEKFHCTVMAEYWFLYGIDIIGLVHTWKFETSHCHQSYSRPFAASHLAFPTSPLDLDPYPD